MNRRQVIKNALAFAGGVALAAAGLATCTPSPKVNFPLGKVRIILQGGPLDGWCGLWETMKLGDEMRFPYAKQRRVMDFSDATYLTGPHVAEHRYIATFWHHHPDHGEYLKLEYVEPYNG